jgi:hypothetical protein
MSFIDSPISRCEAVREMVLTDQTQRQCAFEHECPPGRNCPLDGCFAEISGLTEAATLAEVAAAEAPMAHMEADAMANRTLGTRQKLVFRGPDNGRGRAA